MRSSWTFDLGLFTHFSLNTVKFFTLSSMGRVKAFCKQPQVSWPELVILWSYRSLVKGMDNFHLATFFYFYFKTNLFSRNKIGLSPPFFSAVSVHGCLPILERFSLDLA